MTALSSSELFVVKYSGSGAFIWGKHYSGLTSNTGNSLAVDGSDNLIVARIQPSIPHIMHNIRMKQWGILGYDAHCGAQRCELHLRYVLAVDEDPPRGRLVETV